MVRSPMPQPTSTGSRLQDKKPVGKSFQEVYDLKTIQPTKEWLELYGEVVEEVSGWGLLIS
jgi:hypothetical protein